MNREQAKEILPVLQHFAKGGELWEWYGGKWVLQNKLYIPAEHKCNIIEDKHFESRKAFALGGEIEMSCPSKWVGWVKAHKRMLWDDNTEYRPKPEPIYEWQ